MKRYSPIPPLLLLALALAPAAPRLRAQQAPKDTPGGRVVDGIAAVVDGEPILQSEVEDAAWFARFSARWAAPAARGTHSGTGLTPAEKQAALQHLIDQQLLSEARADEDGPAAIPTPAAEGEAQWARLRQMAGGEEALAEQLRAYHLDAATARALVERQIGILAYLDQHFSTAATVSEEQVQRYYDTVFAPQARGQHLTPAPLNQVRSRIAAILRQQQLDQAEQQWLLDLRSRASIELRSLPMTPRRALGIAAVALVALVGAAGGVDAYLHSAALHKRVERYVVLQLERGSGARVEIGAFHLYLHPLGVELDGVVAHGREAAGQPPLANIPQLRAGIRLASLLHQEISLDQVLVEQPHFHLYPLADGMLNLPQPKLPWPRRQQEARTLFALGVRSLEITQGELDWENRRIPLNLRLSGVGVQLQAETAAPMGPAYGGELHFRRGAIQYAGRPAFDFDTDLRFTLWPDDARVDQLVLQTAGAHLEAQGWLRHFSQPEFEAAYDVQADAGMLSRLGWGGELTAGTAHAAGRLHWSPAGWQAAGEATVTGARGWEAAAALGVWSGEAAYQATQAGLVIPRLDLDGPGSRIRLQGRYDGWNALTLAGGVAGVRLAALPAVLRLAGAAPRLTKALGEAFSAVEGRLSGTVVMSANRLARDRGGDEIAVRLKIAPDPAASTTPGLVLDRAPLSGEVQAQYWPARRRIAIQRLDVALAGNTLQASGSASADAMALQIAAASPDLDGLRPWAVRLIGAFAARPALPEWGGSGSFQGAVGGAPQSPTLSGRLQLAQFRDEAHPQWGTASAITAAGSLGPNVVTLTQGMVEQGAQRLSATGEIGLSGYHITPDSSLHLQMRIDRLSLARIQALAALHYAVSGTLEGRAALRGSWAQPEGDGQFALLETRWKSQAVRSISAAFHLQNDQLTSSNLVVALARTRISGKLQLGLRNHTYRVDASSAGVQLNEIALLQSQRLALQGQVRFQLTGSGSWEQPQAELILTTNGLRGGGENLGDLGARLQLDSQWLQFQAADILPNGSFNLTGSVGMGAPYRVDARLQLRDYDFDAWLRRFTPASLSGHSQVSGTAVLRGPLAEPDQLSAEIALNPVEVALSGLVIRNDGAIRLSAGQQRLTLEQAHIVAQDTDFTVRGQAALGATPRAPMALQGDIEGRINLALLQSLHPTTHAIGQVDVSTHIAGTLAQPRVTGRIGIHNASLAEEDLPIGFDQIQGQLRLSGRRIDIDQLTAQTGSGTLTITGFAAQSAGGTAFDLNARGQNLRLRYQGISASGDLRLRLSQRPGGALLAGDVQLNRIGLDKNFDLALFLAASQSSPNSPDTNALLNRIRLDIHLVTGPQVEVATNLARLQLQADLRLRGTPVDPVVLGRADSSEGRILFAGNEYRVTKAQVQFVNPFRNDPLLDIGLSTTIQQYDITLNIAGPADKLAITYRSDPPLSSSDVVALLATGQPTAATASLSPAAPGSTTGPSEQLLGQALNNVVSGRMQRLFGVTQVQVNADNGMLATTGSSGTVTVQQQVSRNLKLTYTQNLSSSSQDIIQVDWTISRALGITLNRDQFGLYGLAFTFHQRVR